MSKKENLVLAVVENQLKHIQNKSPISHIMVDSCLWSTS